jgi:glycosyltransferase involved in cell wall biosynthesis
VFAGSLSKQFDFKPLLDAAGELGDSPVTFSIAGSGEAEPFLRRQAAAHENIQLLGWLNRLELRALLNRATVGIAPYRSTWDFQASIPNKVIEYLASGLPVVSSLEGEVAGLLESEECGITYQSANGQSLAVALRALLADRPKLERMRANARSLFERRFSGADIYPAMADFLEDFASRSRTLKLGTRKI